MLESLRLLQQFPSTQITIAGATLPRNGRATPGGVLASTFPQLFWCSSSACSHVPSSIDILFVEVANEADKLDTLATEWLPSLQKAPSLLFVRDSRQAELVATALSKQGVKTQILTQDRPDPERDLAVQKVLDGVSVCTICTDIASRGLDSTRIPLVIQYDFARDVSCFLHRCGRTGRNGQKGKGKRTTRGQV